MRKRIYLAALCLGAALAMAGCSDGSTNENDDNTTSSVSGQTESGTEADSGETADGEENDAALEELEALPLVDGEFVLEDCIRLGEYKGLELTRTVEAVTDEDVESYVNSLMTPEEVTDEGATVQEGDTVNIAYEGTQDGVAFEGGTSESADLVIGSGRFIDGFEDGLIGMKAGESRDLNLDEEDESPDIKGNILDFVLPIGVLIALTIVTGELFLALIAAIAVCFLLYIPRKKMTAARFCDLAMHGFCNMIPTVAIIYFVFVMQQGMTDIGIASYVIDAVRPVISPVLLPAITFLLVAALNFATGSTWGIPALVSPIILPLALSIGVNPLVVMGAIVSGATLGSHACFYSDATVLTSSCCKMNNMDHALSQLPYAMCAAGIATAGYLICGFLL